MLKKLSPFIIGLIIVTITWLLGSFIDRFWFSIDHTIPGWDQSENLINALNYWKAFQNPQWFDPKWWLSFWQISNKMPPGTYIATSAIHDIWGLTADQAALINIIANGIILYSVYGLGCFLFRVEVGYWGAIICQVLPGLYWHRLMYLLDVPLTAIVTLTFWVLTVWYFYGEQKNDDEGDISWGLKLFNFSWLSLGLGILLGLCLLVKQTAAFFLFIPFGWMVIDFIKKRSLGRLFILLLIVGISIAVFSPWYRANWLFILSGGKRATIDSAIAEGDPTLTSLSAWTFYLGILPDLVSWPLLIIPTWGYGLFVWKFGQVKNFKISPGLIWILVFLVGGYLLSSANMNKDSRYILPMLPVFSLLLAQGLLQCRWRLRVATIGFSILLMILNMFPIGFGSIAEFFSPHANRYPETSGPWYHQAMIEEIAKTTPYQSWSLGVLPSSGTYNQHNISYFGILDAAQKNRPVQVHGRQVGTKDQTVNQDARSLTWYLTKDGYQGSVPSSHPAMMERVEKNPELVLHKSWKVPDVSTVKLFRKKFLPVEIKNISDQMDQVELNEVIIPSKTPPGVPVPVTYSWSGPSEAIHNGIVIINWIGVNDRSQIWFHDHGLGLGTIIDHRVGSWNIIERMAMLPPADIKPGLYRLNVTYVNQKNGNRYKIAVPDVTIEVNPNVARSKAPEIDLITQLRLLGLKLPQGRTGLDSIFAQVGRINQYDPVQDYLIQAEKTLEYRLNNITDEKQSRDLLYGLLLSLVLQKKAPEALITANLLTKVDANNPNAYAYKAFIYLYNWEGKNAQQALEPALKLNPNLPELQALDGIGALMRGNFIKAWQKYQRYLELSNLKKAKQKTKKL